MRKITLSEEVKKNLKKVDFYGEENFIKDCNTYIKALNAGRLFYDVTHVSSSGMSRNILIRSFEGKMTDGYYRTYYAFLKVLGYQSASKYGSDIRVNGCGMNMLFATNYNIVHSLHRMGFINKEQCAKMAQKIN